MRSERDSLKETIEELHCVQAQEGQLTSGIITNEWTCDPNVEQSVSFSYMFP